MENQKQFNGAAAVNDGSTALRIISWLFGTLFFAIGLVNTFWGNDTLFGIFIILLSLIYFVPVNDILRRIAGFSIPRMMLVKILVGFFIVWASMGVGELPDKVEMMLNDFQTKP